MGFGCARNTPTTFHVFYWQQVRNFSLLKSAPNGVNYIDVRRLVLHAVVELSGLIKYSQHFIVHNFESRLLLETGHPETRLSC